MVIQIPGPVLGAKYIVANPPTFCVMAPSVVLHHGPLYRVHSVLSEIIENASKILEYFYQHPLKLHPHRQK